jgi:hypothetical protein
VWVQFQYRKQGGSWYDWKSLGQKIGPGTVSAKIHDLEPATTYEYRVASYTGGQKRVSEWKTFTTDGDRPQTPTPSVTVKSVTDVGSSSATVASKITDMGNRAWLFPTVKYQKADDDSVWDGSYEYVSHTFRSPQTFDVQVSDLESGTTYEVQVGYWDVDDGGFQWSEAKTFTTAG